MSGPRQVVLFGGHQVIVSFPQSSNLVFTEYYSLGPEKYSLVKWEDQRTTSYDYILALGLELQRTRLQDATSAFESS